MSVCQYCLSVCLSVLSVCFICLSVDSSVCCLFPHSFCSQEQLKGLQQDHRHTVEVLQGQVATLEESLTFLQTRQNKRPSPDRAITSPQDRETLPTSMNERQRPAFLESDDVFRERQQAEV